jgi:hypothetical protein
MKKKKVGDKKKWGERRKNDTKFMNHNWKLELNLIIDHHGKTFKKIQTFLIDHHNKS